MNEMQYMLRPYKARAARACCGTSYGYGRKDGPVRPEMEQPPDCPCDLANFHDCRHHASVRCYVDTLLRMHGAGRGRQGEGQGQGIRNVRSLAERAKRNRS